MEQKTKIAVIGGGGRTGKFLVNQLLKKGYQLKLLLRNPEQFSIKNPNIEILRGDVLDLENVCVLLNGCSAVISTVGQRNGEPLVASKATDHILKAIAEVQKGKSYPMRYILMAGINVDTPFDKKGPETLAATEWMKTNFPLIHKDRQIAYSILAKSAVEWTLVRVPFIEFSEGKGQIEVNVEDSPGQKISAGDIAGFLIEQLTETAYIRKAPFISEAVK